MSSQDCCNKENQASTCSADSTKEKLNKEEPAQVITEPQNYISIDDFARVQLKVGQILEAENMPKSEKLIRMKVDLGEERGPRQILAGIAKHYQATDLIGRKIVVVANLKPAKLMGQLSEGMVLCASDEQGNLELLSPGVIVTPGATIR